MSLEAVGDAFLANLEQKRKEFVQLLARKKKIMVAPGKSITVSDMQSIQEENEKKAKEKREKLLNLRGERNRQKISR